MVLSTLVSAVATTRLLRGSPLAIGRLLASSIAASTGRSVETHLRSVTRRRLSGRASVVALLTVLGCYVTFSYIFREVRIKGG